MAYNPASAPRTAATGFNPLNNGLYLSGLNEITEVLREPRRADPVHVLYKLLGYYYLGGTVKRHTILRGSPSAPNNSAILYFHSISQRNSVARAIRSFARENNTASVFIRDLFDEDQLPLARLLRAYGGSLKDAGACIAFRVGADNGKAILYLLKEPKGSFKAASPADMAGYDTFKQATESAAAENASGQQGTSGSRPKSDPKSGPPPLTGTNRVPVRQRQTGAKAKRPESRAVPEDGAAGGTSTTVAVPQPKPRQVQAAVQQPQGASNSALVSTSDSDASAASVAAGHARALFELQMREAMASALQAFDQRAVMVAPNPMTMAFLSHEDAAGDNGMDFDYFPPRRNSSSQADARKRQ